jgi:hypothetical protein
MNKVEIAEGLSEMLQNYAYEVEEGEHDSWQDDYIVDSLCEMKEILLNDGIEEGRRYSSFSLITDKPVKVYQTITVERSISKGEIKLKVMSIESVDVRENGQMLVVFLAKKV